MLGAKAMVSNMLLFEGCEETMQEKSKDEVLTSGIWICCFRGSSGCHLGTHEAATKRRCGVRHVEEYQQIGMIPTLTIIGPVVGQGSDQLDAVSTGCGDDVIHMSET